MENNIKETSLTQGQMLYNRMARHNPEYYTTRGIIDYYNRSCEEFTKTSKKPTETKKKESTTLRDIKEVADTGRSIFLCVGGLITCVGGILGLIAKLKK